jgi:predicted transposase YbfD/YdcC
MKSQQFQSSLKLIDLEGCIITIDAMGVIARVKTGQ